ncbi:MULTISPECIES: hypothetical protein [Acidobacteriaceae]|uniref:hypothetical protein n=1 Tax=Acidobacteriaceae TaxID=204434 RepID=UPI00131BAAF5|nr:MULTISPECIES: hypothetical protein [Acidobacteriaceae]MDW5264797.1 hypothetical protein [Edaphobacter sp.]
MPRLRPILIAVAVIVILCVGWLLWHAHHGKAAPAPAGVAPPSASNALPEEDNTPTLVYAHNLQLRKGPNFRIYILWLRGQMLRTNPRVPPSFDDPESFVFDIQKGVIHVNIGDVGAFLNAASSSDAPLRNISLTADGDQLKIHGTLHKVVPLPIEAVGSLSSAPDGHIRFHTTKISVLKVPMKGLLGGLHLTVADLVHSPDIPGAQISGNDLIFDTTKLLPPPHIRGELTSVRIKSPDIEVIYGNSPNDESKLAQWHNFLRLTGGTVDFGKLTMHHADLTMIDATKAPWFDLDLVNYQEQLVQGICRMTPQAGLEIFMPEFDEKKGNRKVTLEWLKNRNLSMPSDVPVQQP